MKVFALLVAVLNMASGQSVKNYPFAVPELTPESVGTNPATRIYGGTEAKEGQFPYMIFVLMKYSGNKIARCSASLIEPNWVLLAAHCVVNSGVKPESIIVVGGKADLYVYVLARLGMNFDTPIDEKGFGLEERRAKKFFHHPKFNSESLIHDVALIKLDKPFNSSFIKTIPLSENKMMHPRSCTILGWGLTLTNPSNFKLNFVENKEVRPMESGCIYKSSEPFICLIPDKRGICQGDSGSPLVCDGEVWGVASHLISEEINPNCGDSLEEYYSELYADLDWLKSVYNEGNQTSVTNFKSLLVCVFASLWISLKF